MNYLLIGIAMSAFLGLAIVAVTVFSSQDGVAARLREVTTLPVKRHEREEEEDEGNRAGEAIGSLVGPVRRALGLSSNHDITDKLALIGYNQPYHEDIYYASKIVGPLLAALIAGTLLKSDAFFWFFALGAVGFFAPDFWLSSAVTRWRENLRRSLPDAVDLLVISMEAGLGLDQAILRVGNEMKHSHPELAQEFLTINLEQRAGKRRIEAWKNMADRTELDVVRAFVNMLLQTERFGTPIATSLGHFADSLRTQRRQKAEEMAAKTTVKLIFPLVLFIFPSMFIVMLAPAIIAISEGLSKQFQ